MKSKDQKRAEAIERGKISFAVKHQYGSNRRFDSEDAYLDLFRPKREIIHREHNLPDDEAYSIDCVSMSLP